MCWTNVLTGKHNANPLNISVHLQLLCLHNAYQFKGLFNLLPYGRNFNIKLGPAPNSIRPFWGVRVDLCGRKWYQSKYRPHIPIPLLFTPLAYLAPISHNTQCGRRANDRNRLPVLLHRRPKNTALWYVMQLVF